MSNARTQKLRLFWSVSRHSPHATRHFCCIAHLLILCAVFLSVEFLSPRPAFALDPSLDISQYAHTAWKARDGFINAAITAIAQTPDGYLWLGTDLGLYRFDGARAVLWTPPRGQQLPSDYVRSLLVSRDGTLWIGTSKGLSSWKDGKLSQYSQFAGQIAFGLFQDRAGTVWFVTMRPGRVCAIESGTPKCYGASVFGQWVLALYEDRKGSLWALAETGLWRWKPGSPEQYKYPRGTTEANALIEDANGTLLLATNDGLKQFVGGKIQNYELRGFTGKFRASGFLHSSDGSVWVRGVVQGLLHLHRGAVDTYAAANGLSDDFVNSIFEDREGSVWVGTPNGLDRFRDYAIPTLSQAQGLLESLALSVQATSDGSIWVGAYSGLSRWRDGGVTVYGALDALQQATGSAPDRRGARRRETSSGLAGPPQSLGQDARGRLLVSTRNGAFYLDRNRFMRMNGVPGGQTMCMVGDHAGDVWISNQNVGLFRWTEKSNAADSIAWNKLQTEIPGAAAIMPDSSRGGLWLGFSRGGLAYLKDGQVQKLYTGSDGLGDGVVRDLRFGPRGALWAATDAGLSRIKDGRITTLTSKNGLPCDKVHWSMEDAEHSVWLYTPCGLIRIPRSELDAWVSDAKHIVLVTLFDASDGLRSRQSAGGYTPHATKSADGRIWFAASDGVSIIDPHHLPFNKLPPPVHIEQVTADGKVYDAANGVRLPRLVRYVDIDYTALSLVVPEKVRFRVKLEGEDKDWRELANVRRVSYTNLGPKHYRFLVKACNNSGVWNEEGAALDFVIPPAWYQTYWFLAACVAAFLALLWALYQYRLHQLAQQFNMRLEERVGERTRIARDLHDTLLQSFHGILLFLQSGIHLLDEHPAEAKKTLKTAAEQAERAIIEGREAVQGLRASTVERNDLALAIKTLGGELAAADSNSHRAEFNVQVEGIPHELHPILRDEVFRIGGEAMRNAFRHADAKQIEVEIRYDERQLRLRVRDDGKGIDPKLLSHDGREGHFGLRGMRERAKLIGGKLTVWSELDSGTEVELSIPASRAYTAPTDGQRSWLAEKFAKISQRDTERKS